MVSNKVIIGSALAAVCAGAATLALWGMFTPASYDKDLADKSMEKLNDLVVDATMEYAEQPHLADFQFQLKAAELKATATARNSDYSEYEQWVKDFDAKVKHLRNKFHKR